MRLFYLSSHQILLLNRYGDIATTLTLVFSGRGWEFELCIGMLTPAPKCGWLWHLAKYNLCEYCWDLDANITGDSECDVYP